MHKPLLYLALFLTLGAAQVSAQKSVYALPFSNKQKLPPIEVIIDYDKTARSYPGTQHYVAIEESGEGELSEQNVAVHQEDPILVDALRLMEYYALEELTERGSEFKGKAELAVVYYDVHNRANIGSAFGILSFGIGILLGIPMATQVTQVEIEAILYGPDGNFLESYRGYGKAKRAVSLYNNSSIRRGNHKAITNALGTLNQQLMKDGIPIFATTPTDP